MHGTKSSCYITVIVPRAKNSPPTTPLLRTGGSKTLRVSSARTARRSERVEGGRSKARRVVQEVCNGTRVVI